MNQTAKRLTVQGCPVPNSVLVLGQNWKLPLSSSAWLGIQAFII